MTENSKEKQNEVDAEQALKDFLKELVLSPLEDQQNKFLPKLKNTLQDSISDSEDISETKKSVCEINNVVEKTKSSVETISKNIDTILLKYDEGNAKLTLFAESSNSALVVISNTLNESKNEIHLLKSTSIGLSAKLDEFNRTHTSGLSALEEKFVKEIKDLSANYNTSLDEIKKYVTDEFNKTHDEINKRYSTLSIEILKYFRLGLYFSIAILIILLIIITLIIFK